MEGMAHQAINVDIKKKDLSGETVVPIATAMDMVELALKAQEKNHKKHLKSKLNELAVRIQCGDAEHEAIAAMENLLYKNLVEKMVNGWK